MIFLRNLMRTKVRSLLTLLGITVGIAVFVGVASLTLDMQHQFSYATAAYNTEVMIGNGNLANPARSRISPQQLADLETILEQSVAPMVMGMVPVESVGKIPILGVPIQSLGMIPVIGGRAFVGDKPELLVGVFFAEYAKLRIGNSVRLGNVEYAVVGMFRSGSIYIDGGIITGLDQARRILGRASQQDYYNLALVQTGNNTATTRVVELVRQHFPQLRTQPTVEFSGILQIVRTMQATSWTIGLIALLGAAIVVANTLVMVVSERTRELGVLLSIGWRPFLVLRMLFAEILLLCLAGTLFGNFAAQGLLSLLAQIHPSGHGWNLPTVIAPMASLASAGAALLIALIAMLWPAHVVYRLKPAQALRHA